MCANSRRNRFARVFTCLVGFPTGIVMIVLGIGDTRAHADNVRPEFLAMGMTMSGVSCILCMCIPGGVTDRSQPTATAVPITSTHAVKVTVLNELEMTRCAAFDPSRDSVI